MSDAVIEVGDTSWEKTIEKGRIPAVVMFYSPECPHCRTFEPYFRQMASEYREAVLFARLNVLANPWTAERYGVRATPTFKLFCQGRPVQEMVGGVFPALLKKRIDEVLLHGEECIRNTTIIDYEISGYG